MVPLINPYKTICCMDVTLEQLIRFVVLIDTTPSTQDIRSPGAKLGLMRLELILSQGSTMIVLLDIHYSKRLLEDLLNNSLKSLESMDGHHLETKKSSGTESDVLIMESASLLMELIWATIYQI